MSEITAKATTEVIVNGKQANSELEGLKKQAVDLQKQIDKVGKTEGFNSKGVKKLQRELDKVNKQINTVRGNTELVNRTLANLNTARPHELRLTLRRLKTELQGIQRGTAAWDAHVAKIRMVDRELKKVNADLVAMKTPWEKFTGAMGNGFFAIVSAIGVADMFVQAGRNAVNAFAAMDQEMASVRKFTGMTEEQVAALNEEFKKIDTRTSREELNKLAQEAGRLGLSSQEDVLGFVRAANQINVALDDLGDGATLTLSKLTDIFGDKQRLGVEQSLLSVGSVINELSQNCTASAPYLAQFASRMGGVGAQAGMTIPQVMAFGAVLDSQNQKLEASATAVSQVITRLYRDPAKYAKVAGLDVQNFTKLLKEDANEALLTLLDKLNKAGGMDVLSPMFANMGENGARAISALSTLAKHVDEVRSQQVVAAEAFREATSVTKEYNVQNNTVQAQLEKAKKGFQEMTIELGQKLLPIMRYSVTSGAGVMKILSATVDLIRKFMPLILSLAAAWAAYTLSIKASNIAFAVQYYWLCLTEATQKTLKATVLMLKMAYYALTGQITKAKEAFAAFNALTGKTPWAAIIAAVAALGVAIYKLCTGMDEYTKLTKEAIKNASGYTAEVVKEQRELDILFGRLQGAEKGTKEYESAKKAIINQYGKYLSGLIDEKGEILNLEAAYNRLTVAVRRSAQERGIAAAREQIDQEYYKNLASKMSDLQTSLEKQGASVKEASEIVAAVSQAMASEKPIPKKYVERINELSGHDIRLIPDWLGNESWAPFFGGQSGQPGPLVNQMYKNYETRRKAMESLNAMEDANSPLRKIDDVYLKGTIGQLEKIVNSGKSGNALVFLEGSNQGEYKELTVSEAKTLLAKYQDELAYRGGAKTTSDGMNLDTEGPGGGGGGGGTGGGSGKGGSGSEDKFAKAKEWKEREEALNRIAYATGQKDLLEYNKRMLEIESEFYAKELELTNLTDKERLTIQAQYYETQKKQTEEAVKQTVEEENQHYAEQVAETTNMYLEGLLSKETYDRQLEKLEIYHLNRMAALYEEGTKERLDADEKLRRKLIEHQDKLKKEIEDKEKAHQEELKKIKEKYFGLNATERKAAYDKAVADLKEAYGKEIAAVSGNEKETERIKKALDEAMKKIAEEYDMGEATGNILDRMAEGVNDWLKGDGGKALTGTVDFLVSNMSSLFSQLSSLVQAEAEIEQAKLDKRYDKEISRAEGNNQKVKALERKKAEESAKIKSKAAQKEFNMQVIMAIAQTAQAGLNAYSSTAAIPIVGPALAPAALAIAVATGMLQVAALKKQKEAAEAQGYAAGGFTPDGPKYREAGIVHAGEWVASQELVKSPVTRPVIDVLEAAQRNNTIPSPRRFESAMSRSSAAIPYDDSRIIEMQAALNASLAYQSEVVNRLAERLNEPFVTVNTVTGDTGIKRAQDDYQAMINRTLPKSRRK